MNKLLYRIIFNKARGMLMVVADIARSGQGKQARTRKAQQAASRLCTLSALRFALLSALGCVSILPAQAQVVANGQAPGNQRPTIISSANGITQVNIQTPGAGGVSHNKYSQFDVDKKGVILNNSHANTQTQLGGMVTGNANLLRGEAKVILNEVNAANASQLNGMIEVAGKRAQVVIANPAGITCDGCGFINANRATLTTGQAQLNNGLITGYDVSQGQIVVQGAGLDGRQTDSTDLIARAVSVNAGIWANELKVTAGRNRVDAGNNVGQVKAADGSASPGVAIDVAALGGMYANKIRLVGTEKGVGVHNAGNIGAAAGNVVINAVGSISISNSGSLSAAQHVQLAAQNVSNSGNIYAAGNSDIAARGTISNSGKMYAAGNSNVAARGNLTNSGNMYAAGNNNVAAGGSLTNSGVIAARNNATIGAASINSTAAGTLGAGINSDGTLASNGNLTLNSQGALTVNGQALAADLLSASGSAVNFSGSQTRARDVSLRATRGDISTANATLAATQKLTLNASGTLNNNGGKISANTLALSGRALTNQKGALKQLGAGDLQLSFADGINNASGEIASNSRNLTVNTAIFDNQQGSVLHLGAGDFTFNSTQLRGNKGSLLSNGGMTIKSGDVLLDGATTQAERLTISAASLSHQQGNMAQTGSGTTTINVSGALNNSGGKLATNGDLLLNAGSVNNQRGQLATSGDLALSANSLNNQQGRLVSIGDLTIGAGSINNQQGQLVAGQNGSMQIDTNSVLNNQQGTLAAGGALALKSAGINNTGGLLQSGAGMTLDLRGGELINRDSGSSAGIFSGGSLTLTGGNLDNRKGYIAAKGDAAITAQSFNNQQGMLASDADMTLASKAFNNQNGKVQAGHVLALNTQKNTLTNSNGVLSAGQTLTLLTGALLNSSGQLLSSGALNINTHQQQLDNRSGRISAVGDAQLNSGAFSNLGGQLQIVGNALIASASIDNSAGLLRSGKNLQLTTAQLINKNTQSTNAGIEADAVIIVSSQVDNSAGALRANTALTLNTTGTLNNHNGLLSSGGALTVNGAKTLNVTNTGGTLIAGTALNLSGKALSGDGRVLSQDAMSLGLQQQFVNQGQVIANGNMTFNLNGQALTNQALIRAGKTLTLNAGSLDNQQAGEISAGDNHLLIAGSATNRGMLDGGLTHVVASTFTNIGSGRVYGDHVALQAGTLNNLAENGKAATIAAREQFDLGVKTINNRDHALIYSAGDMAMGGTLDAQQHASGQSLLLNNHSATIESAGNMALNVGEINNVNDHLVTQNVVVSVTSHHEAVLRGAVNRFDWADVDTSTKNKYGVHKAIMPDGTSGRDFYEYEYVRTVTETKVVESDPGQFIAGGNLTITSNQVNNRDSRIVAGGVLGGVIGQLNNVATMGQRVINDVGIVVHWFAKKSGGGLGGTKTSQGKDTDDYRPTDILQTIDLLTMAWQSHAPGSGNGTKIGDRDERGTDVKIIDAGAVSAENGQAPITLPPGQIVEIVVPGDSSTVIRATLPDTKLPDSSLYQTNPARGVSYLIETDPRFTSQKKWLSSDYMQQQFTQDPNQVLKRLGDGYYEQQLIRQQMLALSGQRYLNSFHDDEAQYQALMDAGVTFGKAYGLTPGMALSAQQMALLTSEMVWLVQQTVTLPDGSTQKVLVPQVYARVKQGDLDGSGALLAGSAVSLAVGKDLTNSGHITGRSVTQLSAENINNSGFIGGDKVDLRARADINNIGGTLQGGSSLTAVAGRDINSISTLGGSAGNITFDRPAGIYVQGENGTLGLQALHDVNLIASQISNGGAGSKTQIIAGNDINLNTLTTTHSERSDWGGGNDRTLTQRTEVGSQINGGGDVALSAGHDINARAATVTAQNGLSAAAGNDIHLTSGEDAWHLTENSHQSSGGMLSRKSLTTHDEVNSQSAIGSNFSGDSVTMQAGRDMSLSGSSVAATHDVALAAGRDLTIGTADETRREDHQRKETKSGLSGTGGIGFTVGSSMLKTTDAATTHSSAGSTVGSTLGNVTLSAGNNLTVQGSDVLAGKDLSLSGSEVNILAAENNSTQKHTTEQKQSGLTLALSGTVGSAINTAVSAATSASEESNGRLAALGGMKAALGGVQAYQAKSLAEAGSSEGSMIGVNLSYGSQSSKSEQTLTQNQHQGSQLTAGNNLTINAAKTDINIQGSQLQAGKDVSLSAARDVNLIASQDSQKLDGKNESKGGSVGVGINFGQGANGLSLNASVNKGKGSENGNGTTHNETTVNAGGNLNVSSGRDITLTGAQLSGNRVALDVGRDLTMTSQQDTDNYDSKQQNASAGGSVSMGGGSGSVNLSRDKMHSTYKSVQEQTGIFAGSGGFDVKVGEHTQLNGAVMGSMATADKNRLDTGTLGFSDIKNSAEYEVEHVSVGVSSGGNFGGQFAGNMANGLLAGMNSSGSDSSTTQSAVSDGSIVIRDQSGQKQNLDDLSRDAEHANQTLSPIFDKEKEQNRIREAQMIGEIGNQAADIARTKGEIDGLNQAKKDHPEIKAPGPDAPQKEHDEYLAKLQNTDSYKGVMKDFGTGSAIQQGIQAATAAVQGLAGGNMAQAISGAAAPYLAEQIHKLTVGNPAAQAMAHAVVGAVVAQASGNSALAGAAGAVTGEVMAQLVMKQLYPGKKVSDLTETEKQTISALGTLAAGLAGGVAGNSTADAVAGAQAGNNAASNNALSDIAENKASGVSQQEKYQKAQENLVKATEEFKAQNCAGLSAEACGAKMVAHRDELLAGFANAGLDFVPVVGDIKSFAEAQSAIDYLAATIGLIPGAGDAAGKAIKAAEVALKKGDVAEASKLINKASDEIQAVKPLDVGSYKELKDRSVVGDGLEHDHIPSFAAIRQAKENELGRKLTPAEEKTLYNNATAIEVPKDVHQAGPTYGGKNTLSQVKQDAINLCGAECRDTDALRKNMMDRGYDSKLVDEAIRQLKERNSQTGVTK